MTSNASYYDVLGETSVEEYYIEGFILLVICVFAIFGNLSMWWIICSNKTLRTVTNAFILGLTTADIFVSVVNMPVTVITLFNRGEWMYGEAACQLFGFTNMLTLVTSVLSLCNISINRYVMVCRPLHFKRIYTKPRAAVMITGCVLLSTVLSIPPLIGWAKYAFIPIQSFCFCDWTLAPSYAFFMIFACFGGPFSVMSVCNFFIFRTVRKSKRKLAPNANRTVPNVVVVKEKERISPIAETIEEFSAIETKDKKLDELPVPIRHNNEINKDNISQRLSDNSVTTVATNYSKSDEIPLDEDSSVNSIYSSQSKKKGQLGSMRKRQRRGKERTEEIRLATLLAVVVVAFVICWLPYCISMLLSIYGPATVPRGFHMFTLLVGYLNSALNPVLYGVMNRRFGNGFKKLFCCICQNQCDRFNIESSSS